MEQYGLVEIELNGTADGNPYVEVELSATFTHIETGRTVRVGGFYRGEGRYAVRFMPESTGEWTYATASNDSALDGITGTFATKPPSLTNHGPVRLAPDVLDGEAAAAYGTELPYRFCYADGTPYQPYGTTCYAWTNQSPDVQERTLATLAQTPFNKIRMCVFPKFYDFNTADPVMFAYEGSMAHGFDHTRFNEPFFANLDRRIAQLAELGIEADIILLHPYDKPEWGFSRMSKADDERYLAYMARRYGAYRNVWWSLANEYDLMPWKGRGDWRDYAHVIMANDAFGHLRSVHNCVTLYDWGEDWVTHCSYQRVDVTRTTEPIAEYRERYGKPVICDEPGYEGNIYWGWGNLPGTELMRRFWEGAMRGGYVTHGETYIDCGPQIWWAHGGELHGEAPERIAFMRSIFAEAPLDAAPLGAALPLEAVWPSAAGDAGVDGTVESSAETAESAHLDAPTPITPAQEKAMQYWDVPVLRSGLDWQLVYFGWYRPAWRDFSLPAGRRYAVDVIDTWNMTVETLPGIHERTVRVPLGRQWLAVRIRRVD
ncbi:DUF5060 domain-containing protein [Bifidobacterium callitrichidarum]|uniref:DUF5060 domain-containing protein n=1 Tax=Bifidobacterium callitrichidarum TaxID=2052941 RepID=UPI001F4EE9CF|nr:DUF5060 domain-containing protein [Bifidobacterium callitrichidarum]